MRLIEHFFRLLAPDECISCGTEGSLLCDVCVQGQLKPLPDRCYRCFCASPNNLTCLACRQQSLLRHVWVRTSYGKPAKRLVHALKFTFTRSAGHTIAHELLKVIPALPKNTIVVHVPAATSHIRQRGFDQSAVIAKNVAQGLGLPHIHVLARLGQQRQVGSSQQIRKKQMKTAFRPLSIAAIQQTHVLLVDDVLTTGSTLEAAALTLKQAGAATVSAVVFAQA